MCSTDHSLKPTAVLDRGWGYHRGNKIRLWTDHRRRRKNAPSGAQTRRNITGDYRFDVFGSPCPAPRIRGEPPRLRGLIMPVNAASLARRWTDRCGRWILRRDRLYAGRDRAFVSGRCGFRATGQIARRTAVQQRRHATRSALWGVVGRPSEYLDEDGARAMAVSRSVAVLLPGAYLMLRETQPPPVALLRKHGVAMALASDANPGSSPALSARLMMLLGCQQFNLTPREALWGMTLRAARALGMADTIGSLEVGKAADMVV